MDWRNYQFWRKNIRRVDAKTAEFELLVQGTINRIVLGNKIERCLQLLQGTSTDSQKISKREIVYRNLRNLRQNIPIFKRF